MDVSSNGDRLKSAAHPVPTSTSVPLQTCPAPKISVVMPMYKESLPVLSRTVDSILQQTFKELELVVVVDNPDYQEAVEFLRACS